MVAWITEEVYVFQNKCIFVLCPCHVYLPIIIKADCFMVGYAVAESFYLLKFIEHCPLA